MLMHKMFLLLSNHAVLVLRATQWSNLPPCQLQIPTPNTLKRQFINHGLLPDCGALDSVTESEANIQIGSNQLVLNWKKIAAEVINAVICMFTGIRLVSLKQPSAPS